MWDRDATHGKTPGILGLGAIGREVARKAAALELTGTKRVPEPVPHVTRAYPPEATNDVLDRSTNSVATGSPPSPAGAAGRSSTVRLATDPDEDRPMRGLYPPIEPHQQAHLNVSGLHAVYYEQSGNPEGQPVLFVHGGPGGGTEPFHRQFFDPAAYRIVLFDQRGSGKSRPHACLEENTTWHLVEDMERIRRELGVDRWVVFGGSWGSTLSLAYAETHPDRIKALVLRGIFLVRPKEIRWFYQEGASFIYPDAWEAYLAPIPPEERHDLVAAYYRRLTSADPAVRVEAARAWSVWEGTTSRLRPDPKLIDRFADDVFAEAFARIECHYFAHGCFLRHPDQLLDDVARIRHVPAVIVQGRYDVVCPMISAWELHRRWPEAELHVVPDAGHSAMEPGIVHELVEATDRFRAV